MSVQPRRLVHVTLAAFLAASGMLVGSASPTAATGPAPQVAMAVNVYHPDQPALDHLFVLVDKIIDPTSIPEPDDFTILRDGVTSTPTAVRFQYAGFAGPNSAFNPPGISFIRLDIAPIPTPDLSLISDFTVTYRPDVNRIRDRALAEAPANTLVVELGSVDGQDLIAGTIDHEYGANKLLLFTSQPLDLASIPNASDFNVTIGTVDYGPASVAAVLTDLGLGVIELTLSQPVPAGSEGQARVVYTPVSQPVIGRFDGATLQAFDVEWVYFFLPSNDLSATVGAGGGTLTTLSGGVSESDPVATTLASPSGGAASISEGPLEGQATAGYAFFGQQIDITAPAATDPNLPIVLTFDLHASLLPAGETAQTVAILRNGVPVPNCDPSMSSTPVAVPAPCVWSRTDRATGDISIVVATLAASTWNFGVRLPVAFDGFYAPVDNHVRNGARAGSAIPLKFSLDGDRGLDIFAAGSPSSRAVSCTTSDPYDEIEQTVTAGKSSLQYTAATDTYTYVWKTDRSWTGCRKLTITFFDGTTQEVVFQFR